MIIFSIKIQATLFLSYFKKLLSFGLWSSLRYSSMGDLLEDSEHIFICD